MDVTSHPRVKLVAGCIGSKIKECSDEEFGASWVHVKALLSSLLTEPDARKEVVFIGRDGGKVGAHSWVVAACSRFMKSAMKNYMQKNNGGTFFVLLPDVPTPTIKSFLEILYCTRSASPIDHTPELESLVEMLQVDLFHKQTEIEQVSSSSFDVIQVTNSRHDTPSVPALLTSVHRSEESSFLDEEELMEVDPNQDTEEDDKCWYQQDESYHIQTPASQLSRDEPLPKFIPTSLCPGPLMGGVTCAEDFVSQGRGRDSLRSHASKHKIPMARQKRVNELSEVLWQHYLDMHTKDDIASPVGAGGMFDEDRPLKRRKVTREVGRHRQNKDKGGSGGVKIVYCYKCGSSQTVSLDLQKKIRDGLEIPKAQQTLGSVYYQCIECCGPGNGSSEPGVCKRCKLVYWGLVHQCPPSALECSTCGKIFTSAYKLQFHLNQHNGLNPFKCRHCDFTRSGH